jgi:lipopolysaccharide assembly protein B
MGAFLGVLALLGLGWFLGTTWSRMRYTPPSEERELTALAETVRLLAKENNTGAVEILRKYVADHPEATDLYLALGSLFRKIGDTERAVRIHQNVYRSPSATREQKVEALVELATDHGVRGEYGHAAELLEQALKEKPWRLKLHREVGHYYLLSGQLEQAYIHVRKYMKKVDEWNTGTLAELQCRIGGKSLDAGEYRKAVDCFQNALELNADEPAASLGLGRAQLARGKPEAAIDALHGFVRRFPDRAVEAWPLLEQAAREARKEESLEGILTGHLADHPEDATAHLALAEHLYHRGLTERALSSAEKALELNAADPLMRMRYLRILHAKDPQLAAEQAIGLILDRWWQES